MTDSEIARAESELADERGDARALPLARLGKMYQEAYWEAGPGSLKALPYLDKAVAALDEAYEYFDPQDMKRQAIAVTLGMLRGLRYIAHDGTAADSDEGIRLLEETLKSADLQATTAVLASIILGQIYVRRAAIQFQAPNFLFAAMRTGAPEVAIDLDRAVHCFTVGVDTASLPELVNTAQTMLGLADAMRTMVNSMGAPSLGTQLDAMMQALASMQRLQRSGLQIKLPDAGAQLFDVEWATHIASVHRPVALVQGEVPEQAPAENREPPERPTPTLDLDVMRQDMGRLLRVDGNVYATAVDLLRAEQPPREVDDFVALATVIVHEAGPATSLDHFLLSAALYLRSIRDKGGWVEPDDSVGGDLEAATESLLTAAKKMPEEDPDGIPPAVYLATLLPAGTLTGLGAQLSGLTATMRTVGAEALYFPEPAASLRWDATKSCFESADVKSGAQNLIIVGDEAPPAAVGTIDDLIVSYVTSLSQLSELSHRPRRPVTEEPVFIANPRGDREFAANETKLLRQAFYPHSTGLGSLLESADAAGTADEVRAHLGASLLHLNCGVTATGSLELAHRTELDLTTTVVTRGGLAILPPDHFQPLADILVTVGYTGVIAWQRPVSQAIAAAASYLLHAALADGGLTPAQAVREVRRWLRHPDLDMLPSLLAEQFDSDAEAGSDNWRRLVYRGT